MVFSAGDMGPDGAPSDTVRSKGISRFMELDLEGGAVVLPLPGDGPRLRVGACRMRRSPDRPSPCSPGCSGIIGDLCRDKRQRARDHGSLKHCFDKRPHMDNSMPKNVHRRCTYFDMLANSIAVLASSEYLLLTFVLTLKVGL